MINVNFGTRIDLRRDLDRVYGKLQILEHVLIDAERQCCRFLRFALTVEPDAGPIRLEFTGPRGAQAFVEALPEW
jgi:hypothetical protein